MGVTLRRRVIVAVHAAALRLIQERVRSRRCTIASLTRLSGLSEPAVSSIVSGRRRAGAQSLSLLVSAAYLTRDEVWTEAGVCPVVAPAVFRSHDSRASFPNCDLSVRDATARVKSGLYPKAWGDGGR